MSDPFFLLRNEMIEYQLKRRGISKQVLDAFFKVPRELFVPDKMKNMSYTDSPLPIESGQTISQPYIVALMTQSAELKKTDRVLEVGTGSGYQAAILAQLVDEVYSIERISQLSSQAKRVLLGLGLDFGLNRVHLKIGDGSLGWKEKGPYDAILVTAGAPILPLALIEQLGPGGRLVIPVGEADLQRLLRIRKDEKGNVTEEMIDYVRFVPLIGEQGW